MKITKRQLKRIIKEERAKLQEELSYHGTPLSDALKSLEAAVYQEDEYNRRVALYEIQDWLDDLMRSMGVS